LGSIWLTAGTSYDLVVEAATAVADPALVVEWESPSKRVAWYPSQTVAEVGLTQLDRVARRSINGKFVPSTTPSSTALKAQPVSGDLGLQTVLGHRQPTSSPYLYIVGRFGQVKYIDPNVGTDTGQGGSSISVRACSQDRIRADDMAFPPPDTASNARTTQLLLFFY